MEKLEWKPVFYNGLETNIEVTKCGRVRRIKNFFYGNHYNCKLGEIDFSKLKLDDKGYLILALHIDKNIQKTVRIQQLVAAVFLNYKFNEFPKSVVMHLDNNPLNNNLSNLKIGSQRENCSQLRTIKKGLPTGVYFDKLSKKYRAKILVQKKQIHLGLFKTIEEASNAYKEKIHSLKYE